MLGALVLPTAASAGWSAPLTLSHAASSPAAVATDAAGEAAVAWETFSSLPPASLNLYCSLHPFKRVCYPVVSVHLAVRTASGRTTARTVWRQRSGELAVSVVIARGQVTLAWGGYDVGDPNETAREAHGSVRGGWSRPRTLGHYYDVTFTGGTMPLYPRLAVAPAGRVLAAWSACSSVKVCPGAAPGVTLAWRSPAGRFGRSHRVLTAPEGSVPSFDAGGQAYLYSGCSGRVLLAAPGSRSFDRVLTLARGAVRQVSLGLSGRGEGLASWIPTRCSVDQAAGPLPGPVLASRLLGGRFAAPGAATPAGASAAASQSVAVPGGGIVSWYEALPSGFPSLSSVSLGTAPSLGPGTSALAADGAGDVLAGRPRWPVPSVAFAVLPAGGGALQSGPGQDGLVAGAPFGRGAAHAWTESGGPLLLSLWRP